MSDRPSAGQRASHREHFVASKRVSRLLRQSLLGLLVVLLAALPLSLGTPALQLPRLALVVVHTLGAASLCLALSLRTRHQRMALNLATLGVFAVSAVNLLNTGLRFSGAALLLLVVPILLLGVAHHRRGVLVATALGLAAVLTAVGLELHQARPPEGSLPRQFVLMLLLRAAFAVLTLGGIGFLIDRFLAILREREEFLAGIFTNIETAVLVYDLDARGDSYVAAMNPACAELLGVTATALVGRRHRELCKTLAGTALTRDPVLCAKLGKIAQSTQPLQR